MVNLLNLVALGFVAAVTGRQLRPSKKLQLSPVPTGYTFENFLKDFSKGSSLPVPGSSEYKRRDRLFQLSLAEVHATNKENARRGRLWAAGIHPFMDWTEEEQLSLHGYRPGAVRKHVNGFSAMQVSANGSLPSTAEWLNSGSAQSGIRNQGHCGSCWAIAAAEAVEGQLRRNWKGTDEVSAQALVDCVPNPQHCGGDGGCHGATSELAFQFIRDHGIPLEEEYPYTSAETHHSGKCPMSQDNVWSNGPGVDQMTRRAKVSGWQQLPSNQAEPLKQAVYNNGPTVVAVDARGWHNYREGIFDSCDKDAVLGHAVLAVGYGDDSGKKYWDIQNSWGDGWGEDGHIRVLRPEKEDDWCGMDRRPKEGVACDGSPDEVKVCGMCGILYDASVPQGAYIETVAASSATSFSTSDSTPTSYTPWTPDAPSASPSASSVPSADAISADAMMIRSSALSASTDATAKLYTPWTPDGSAASTSSDTPVRKFDLSSAFDTANLSPSSNLSPSTPQSAQDASSTSASPARSPALSLATDDTRLEGVATVDAVRRFLFENAAAADDE